MVKKKKKQVVAYKDLKDKVAIVWTRVSSYKQEKENCSLETQKSDCERFAEENNIRIKYYRGGRYESAKSEGTGFKEMVQLAKKDPEINVILIRSSSRFGRAGEETMATKARLRQVGIYVIPATEPFDPDDKSSRLLDNMRSLLDNYDNELRKDATYSGTKASLNRGEWCLHAPFGYRRLYKEGTHHIFEITPMGEILRNAWVWRAEGMKEIDIVEKLNNLGLRVNQKYDSNGNIVQEGRPMQLKYFSKILKNRFYTGWIEYDLVETPDHRIKGHHPALIDETTFNIANGYCKAGYEKAVDNQDYPLNSFVRCEHCGCALSGYTAKRQNKNGKVRQYRYYKCSTRGCKQNFPAEVLHEQFLELLERYHVKEEFIPLFRRVSRDLLSDSMKDTKEQLKLLKSQKTQLETKKEEVAYRLAVGEIERPIYDMAIAKIQKELNQIQEQLDVEESISSNVSNVEQKMVLTACKLGSLWKDGGTKVRKGIQDLVFPEGIAYSMNFGYSRTSRINEVFEIILFIISQLDGYNKTKRELDLRTSSCRWSRRC